MRVAYANFTNVDAHYRRPYRRGDRLVRGYEGQLEVQVGDVGAVVDVHDLARRLFDRHNADDRPDGQPCPSMSVGDVVIIGEVAVSVAAFGFEVVSVDRADLIVDRPWHDVVGEPEPMRTPAGSILDSWSAQMEGPAVATSLSTPDAPGTVAL